MPNIIKPTAEEKRIIRDCAERSAGRGRVEICPSTKVHLTENRGEHFNVLFVTDDPEPWADTDLFDNAFAWKDFTRGIELTDDGRGIFDFYVYETGGWRELRTNVTAYYEAGRLVRVEGTCNGTMWALKK